MILSLGACIEFNSKQSCWACLTLIYFLRYRSAIPGPLFASDLALRRRRFIPAVRIIAFAVVSTIAYTIEMTRISLRVTVLHVNAHY